MTTSCAPNIKLKAHIDEARISYDTLAADIRRIAAESGDCLKTNRSGVCAWVVKGKQPAPATARYIAEALSRRLGRHLDPVDLGFADTDQGPEARLGCSLGPDPVAMLRRLGEADIQRRGILTGAAYSVAAAALPLAADQAVEYQQRHTVGRAGRAEIEAVHDMTAMFVRIDERHGGQHGRAAVAQYLTSDVSRLCRASFPSAADHADMLSAAADVAYLCGWKAYDAGEHGLAQRYYLQAFGLLKEADDPVQQAFVLRILAHNGMDIRQPAHTLDLADAALSRVHGQVDAATEALFAVTRARALANADRPIEAAAQLRGAQDLVLRGDEAALPRWAALWGSARSTVSSHTAKTIRRIGDHAGAERHFAAAARSRPASQQRITALTIAAQGREQAAQGHVEQACDTWQRAIGLLQGVYSARASDAVGEIRRTLRPLLHRGTRVAAELDEAAREWEAVHA